MTTDEHGDMEINGEESEMDQSADPGAREFGGINEALRSWRPMAGRAAAWQEIETVISRLASVLGDITRIHIPVSEPYVAVTFGGEPDRVGAYIAVGHIDHIVEIADSFVPDVSPNYWRTPLATCAPAEPSGSKGPLTEAKCPNCSMWISIYAECTCGWRPPSDS